MAPRRTGPLYASVPMTSMGAEVTGARPAAIFGDAKTTAEPESSRICSISRGCSLKLRGTNTHSAAQMPNISSTISGRFSLATAIRAPGPTLPRIDDASRIARSRNSCHVATCCSPR